MARRRTDIAPSGPKRATQPDAEFAILAKDEPPPDPRLLQLTRLLARIAAREWYGRQKRGK
jgi:hypothetical protein